MNLELGMGLASIYFITDPDRGIGTVQSPYLLLAHRTLRLEDFAAFIVRMAANDKARVHDALRLLREVIADKSLSKAIALPDPVLVIADDFEPELLSALKRLKLRGLASVVAVRAGIKSKELEEPGAQLFHTFREAVAYAEGERALLAFRAVPGLWVVSGLHRTVLSTVMNGSEIVRTYPGLVADVSNVREPL